MRKEFVPLELCCLLSLSKTKRANVSAISAMNRAVPSDAATMTSVDVESFLAVFRSLKLDGLAMAKVVKSVEREDQNSKCLSSWLVSRAYIYSIRPHNRKL